MATDYTSDVVAFFQDLYPLPEGKPIIPPFLGDWLRTAFPLPDGHPAARNIVDSRSKKQGKSALAGCVALYMASRKRYAEVAIAASDKDQAKDRVYRSLKFAVEGHPVWRNAKVYRDIVELDQGSIIQVLPYDWKGAAGGNYSCVVLDELHTYTQEGQRRMYDELQIPPTVEHGVRWISSYAGFLGESLLLKELWDKALDGRRLPGELPIYFCPDASLLALIDVGEASWRMPWSTREFMAQVEASERPNTYRRLWLNEWVSNESEFITPAQWEACKSPDVHILAPGDKRKLIFGADASTSRDLTALVGVDPVGDTLVDVCYSHVWRPKKSALRFGKPTIDLSQTIGAEILALHQAGNVGCVYYDPYQLHSIALDLARAGVRMIELPQTAQRTAADQALYDAIIAQTLRHNGDATLTEHVNNAVALETPRGLRLAKERTSRKIDAAVALSMAHFGALESKKNFVTVEIIPDPFSDAAQYWNYKPHPEGVTWRNCPHREAGCAACVEELKDDPQDKAMRELDKQIQEMYAGQYEGSFNPWE